jgi:hypothetical protein
MLTGATGRSPAGTEEAIRLLDRDPVDLKIVADRGDIVETGAVRSGSDTGLLERATGIEPV